MKWARSPAPGGSVDFCRRKGGYFLMAKRIGTGLHWRLFCDVNDGLDINIGGRGLMTDSVEPTKIEEENVQNWADAIIERKEFGRVD